MSKRSLNKKAIALVVLLAFVFAASVALAKDNKIKLVVTVKGIPAIMATVKADGKKAQCDASGTAEMNLAPGKYKVEVLAGGISLGKKNLKVKPGKSSYKIKL